MAGGDRRLIVVKLQITAVERGERTGEDRATAAGLELRVVLGIREELRQLGEVDNAVGALGVGVDSAARLARHIAEVNFAAGLGVDAQRGVTCCAGQRAQATEIKYRADPVGHDCGAIGLGELCQGRKRQVAAAVGVKVRRGDGRDVAGVHRRLIVVKMNVAAVQGGECPRKDRAAVARFQARVILSIRDELR